MASNSQVELNAIKKLMSEKSPELLVSISPDYFGNGEIKKIFMIIRKFYTENSEFPGWATLSQYIGGLCKTADKTKFMMALMKQIEDRDISGLSTDLLLKEMRDYQKFRLVLSKAGDLVQAVEDKDIESTLGRLKELHDSVFVEHEFQLKNSDLSEMVGDEIKFEFRSTGIPPLDERGGLIKGGYTIIAAPAKTGKSTLATMMAVHQYLNEEGSVAVFSYEMGVSEVRARIFANLSDIDVGAMMDGNLTAAEKSKLWRTEAQFYCDGVPDNYLVNFDLSRQEFFNKVFAEYPKRKNKFYIFDERIDWDELFIKMNLLVTTCDVKCTVVDYQFLVPRGKAHKELASWEYNLLMSKNLKTFSHKFGLNMICPAQLDQGKKGDDPKLRFISNMINDADLAIYLINTDEDKTLGTVTWRWAAFRNYKTIKDKPMLQDFKLEKQLQYSRFVYHDF